MWVLTPFIINYNGLGSYPFARHYLGNRCFTFFSSCYLDGSVHRVPFSYTILFMYGYQRIITGEFPHSEIFGSRFICNSPKLIAAYHVFHRRLVPRHPPYALHSLIVYIYKTNCYTSSFEDLKCLLILLVISNKRCHLHFLRFLLSC